VIPPAPNLFFIRHPRNAVVNRGNTKEHDGGDGVERNGKTQ
jgi:hypothetical protein